MAQLNPDDINRTALLAMHDGSQRTLEAALDAHAATGIIICADTATCRDVHGQAALLTATVTAARAFGTVVVLAPDAQSVLADGPAAGQRLTDALVQQGAQLCGPAGIETGPLTWPVLLLGAHSRAPACAVDTAGPPRSVLRITWSGWTASIRASTTPSAQPPGPPCILAPIAAAAIGVSEAFGSLRAVPGSDAGYRSINLNLWSPGTNQADIGPALAHAPTSWWLVGLGHLGQAFTWVLSWLPYPAPHDVQLILQDTDRTSPANHSTGVLTPPGSTGIRKTRLIADALNPTGLDTRIIERRLGPDLRTNDNESHIALIGVDNLPTRRLTSDIGWDLAIDVGLGHGPASFASMHLRRFPGAYRSDQIASWRENPTEQITIPATPGFADLAERHDPCGVIELAGKAVGASFVGITAACLAVAEATRELHGGPGLDVLTFDLLTLNAHSAPATTPVDVISCPLSQVDIPDP
jgi:hypothetical protein